MGIVVNLFHKQWPYPKYASLEGSELSFLAQLFLYKQLPLKM